MTGSAGEGLAKILERALGLLKTDEELRQAVIDFIKALTDEAKARGEYQRSRIRYHNDQL